MADRFLCAPGHHVQTKNISTMKVHFHYRCPPPPAHTHTRTLFCQFLRFISSTFSRWPYFVPVKSLFLNLWAFNAIAISHTCPLPSAMFCHTLNNPEQFKGSLPLRILGWKKKCISLIGRRCYRQFGRKKELCCCECDQPCLKWPCDTNILFFNHRNAQITPPKQGPFHFIGMQTNQTGVGVGGLFPDVLCL